MAGYSPTTFVNGTTPAINADNLNKTEQGVEAALGYDSLQDLRDEGTPTSVQTAYCRGHTTCGDGGAGLFYWDSASTESDDDGVVLLPTSHASAGRWVRMFTGAVNVAWFGVTVDDDTVDNQPAFEAAFAAAGQGVVVAPSVRDDALTYYYIGTPIEVPTGCILRGDGSKNTRIQTKPSGWTGSYAVRVGDGDHLTATAILGTRVEDLTIDCSNQSGVYAGYSTQCNEQSGFIRCQLSSKDTNALRISISDVGKDAATVGSPKNFVIRDVEAYALDCAASNTETVFYIDAPFFHDISAVTVVGDGFGAGTANASIGLYFTGVSCGHVSGVHIEGADTGILIGGAAASGNYANGLTITNVTGPSALSGTVTSLVGIGAETQNQHIRLTNLQKRSATNVLLDAVNSVTYTESTLDYTMSGGAVGERNLQQCAAGFDGSDMPYISYYRDANFVGSLAFRKVTTSADYDLGDLNPTQAATFLEVQGTTTRTITFPDAADWDGRVLIISGVGAATTHTLARTGTNVFFNGSSNTSLTLSAFTTWAFIGSATGVGYWSQIAP